MAEICTECFRRHDAFDSCPGNTSASDKPDTQPRSLSGLLLGGLPLVGFLLDFLLPVPSSLLWAILLTVAGSILGGVLWTSLFFRGQKSLRFFLGNVPNFIYLPNMTKLYGNKTSLTRFSGWIGLVLASVTLQLLVFTPGNATYIAGRVSQQIADSSGSQLEVSCPQLTIYTYNSTITCEIQTGLLAFTAPARVSIEPLLGVSEIEVSLL